MLSLREKIINPITFFVTGIILVLLTGCEPSAKNVDDKYPVRSAALKDCTISQLESTSGNEIIVVRCPNSSTTTRTTGKHQKNITVIEDATPSDYSSEESITINGEEYIKKN